MAKQPLKNKSEGMATKRTAFTIAGVEVQPGERRRIDVPIPSSFGQGESSFSVVVLHGVQPGPVLFVSAAIHGDEINGVEIIRRLLATRGLRRLSGTLVAVPVVNVYGFMAQTRYLPDRRDLNRAFPGSPKGSLASRLAHIFTTEIVDQCTHGIDLHTGAIHRSNLPQLRACLDRGQTAELADAFGVPVVLHANVRDGSLRQAVVEREMPMLLYEAGEALRFDEVCIRAGVRGVVNVMRKIGMLQESKSRPPAKPTVCVKSKWERAPEGGVLRMRVALGDRVHTGQTLAMLSDATGENEITVVASVEGIVIGCTNLPLVNEGDAIFNLAICDESQVAADNVAAFHADLDPDNPSLSEEPPIA
ncbi:MAG: putative deacylase [Planctomycetota bacterium]|jgi:predicted deacylase